MLFRSGARGAGACELFGLEDRVDLRMGTFSKSLASCGGFIAGPGDVIEYLKIASRPFMFTASAVPAAVGAALGRPGEKVIALLGDGSAMYAIQGLWSAAQLALPISFIIVNNRRYEALVGFGRRFGLDNIVGTQLPGIDFVALAEGQGVRGRRVETAEALDDVLSASLASSKPSLVEVVVA